MPRTSMAFTVPAESSLFFGSGIHRQPTRIIRSQAERVPARVTVVSRITTPGIGCHACHTVLEVESQFCGMCGRRVRARTSRIGAVIDGLYEVQATIAEGANATVYRARYLPTGEDLALKVLHPDAGGTGEPAARFRREARTMSRIRSANAVAAFDHGETDDGAPYIAMELLDGERLDVRVRVRGAQPWRTALAIMRDLCGALEELHGRGIVHRDVCPRNVMLAAAGTAKLIDFGLAKLCMDDGDEELARSGRAVGALGYAAPELLAGDPCDGRADLFSLGMIGWELMTGRLPRAGAAMPRHVPAKVERLLRRCVEVDRAERFPQATELRREIEALLEERDVPAVSPHPRIYAHTSAFELLPPRIVIARGSEPELAVPRAPRGRWKLWAAALAICGIGLGTAVAGCV